MRCAALPALAAIALALAGCAAEGAPMPKPDAEHDFLNAVDAPTAAMADAALVVGRAACKTQAEEGYDDEAVRAYFRLIGAGEEYSDEHVEAVDEIVRIALDRLC